jgi:hypothetical protein
MDLRFPPLSPIAAPVIVHRDLVCVSLDLRVSLILVYPNPGIAEPLFTVSMSTVDLV